MVGGDERPRHGRPGASTVGVTVVLVAAGVLFATSAETARGTQLRADRGDLAGLITAEAARHQARSRRVQVLQAQVDDETRAAAVENATVRTLRLQAEPLAGPAGLEPAIGPGLVVTLDDAPRDRSAAAEAAPDDLVVHQQDVQAVVNALWAGGAEAMMLQDQRVISTSAVRCVGNTLILQGRVYSPPYTVAAIGNVARMRQEIDTSPTISVYSQYVVRYGLGFTIQQRTQLRMPAYAGSLDLRHARVPQQEAQP